MILLPSRGRPSKLARYFEAYHATEAVEPGIVMIEARDEEAYADVALPEGWRKVTVPQSLVSKKFNDGAFVYAPNESRYFVMADDVVPETKHWDQILVEEAEDYKIAFGNDCINPPPPVGHPCIGGNLVRALGWLAHPAFGHFYWDNALRDIALGLGDEFLTYRPDIVMRHLHWTVTGEYDQACRERGDPSDDKRTYQSWKAGVMAEDIERVKCAFGFYHRA